MKTNKYTFTSNIDLMDITNPDSCTRMIGDIENLKELEQNITNHLNLNIFATMNPKDISCYNFTDDYDLNFELKSFDISISSHRNKPIFVHTEVETKNPLFPKDLGKLSEVISDYYNDALFKVPCGDKILQVDARVKNEYDFASIGAKLPQTNYKYTFESPVTANVFYYLDDEDGGISTELSNNSEQIESKYTT